MPGNNIDFVNSNSYKFVPALIFLTEHDSEATDKLNVLSIQKKMKSKVKVNLWKLAEGDRAVRWTQNAVMSPEITYWLNNTLWSALTRCKKVKVFWKHPTRSFLSSFGCWQVVYQKGHHAVLTRPWVRTWVNENIRRIVPKSFAHHVGEEKVCS